MDRNGPHSDQGQGQRQHGNGPHSDQGQGQHGQNGHGQDQSPPAEELAVGDLMDVSPQDRGVQLARGLLESTDETNPADERTEHALQAAKGRLNDAQKNLERARQAHRVHEVAVKVLQEVYQQRTYVSDAAADLGQDLNTGGVAEAETEADGGSDTDSDADDVGE